MSVYKRKEIIGDATLYLGDCLPVMAQFENDEVDAVVTDPPYGIGEDGGDKKRKRGGTRIVCHKKKNWDKATPDIRYFLQMFRISREQAIFGGNYFTEYLPPSMGWVYWDKKIGGDFSDGELVYTSKKKALRSFAVHKGEGNQFVFHPTQKPIKIITFVINYLCESTKIIIDPFMGSGTTGVACHMLGHKFIGIEQDEEYFDIACNRIEQAQRQLRLFDNPLEVAK